MCTKGGASVSEDLGPGKFFGELALLNNDTRAATCTAKALTTCLTVDRATFNRLLGPLSEMLAQNQNVYAQFMTGVAGLGAGVAGLGSALEAGLDGVKDGIGQIGK